MATVHLCPPKLVRCFFCLSTCNYPWCLLTCTLSTCNYLRCLLTNTCPKMWTILCLPQEICQLSSTYTCLIASFAHPFSPDVGVVAYPIFSWAMTLPTASTSSLKANIISYALTHQPNARPLPTHQLRSNPWSALKKEEVPACVTQDEKAGTTLLRDTGWLAWSVCSSEQHKRWEEKLFLKKNWEWQVEWADKFCIHISFTEHGWMIYKSYQCLWGSSISERIDMFYQIWDVVDCAL